MTNQPPIDGWGVLEHAVELARRDEDFVLATVVWRQGPSSGQQGSRAIVMASGQVLGWIGGACAEPVLVREALRALDEGEPRLLALGTTDELIDTPEGVTAIAISCQSDGALQVFIEPF
ncbi:MAG: XdhC family protein, partial [Acidimicrobiia bacterium]